MKYVLIDQIATNKHNKIAYIGANNVRTFDIKKAEQFNEEYVNLVTSMNKNLTKESVNLTPKKNILSRLITRYN